MGLGQDLKWILSNEEYCEITAYDPFAIRSSEAIAKLKHIKGISQWIKDNETLSDDLSDFVVSSTELGTYITDMYK